jgi:hypothetical protein
MRARAREGRGDRGECAMAGEERTIRNGTSAEGLARAHVRVRLKQTGIAVCLLAIIYASNLLG